MGMLLLAAASQLLDGPVRVAGILAGATSLILALAQMSGVTRGQSIQYSWLSDAPIPLHSVIIAGVLGCAGLVHAGYGMIDDPLPAWKMFRRVARFQYEIRNRLGESLNLQSQIPERAYFITGSGNVEKIAIWYAQQNPDSLPVTGRLVVDHGNYQELKRFRLKHGPDGQILIGRASRRSDRLAGSDR